MEYAAASEREEEAKPNSEDCCFVCDMDSL